MGRAQRTQALGLDCCQPTWFTSFAPQEGIPWEDEDEVDDEEEEEEEEEAANGREMEGRHIRQDYTLII